MIRFHDLARECAEFDLERNFPGRLNLHWRKGGSQFSTVASNLKEAVDAAHEIGAPSDALAPKSVWITPLMRVPKNGWPD